MKDSVTVEYHGPLTRTMVFILDGCSFHYAHTWSKSGISICRRHLIPSKESSNSFFSEKTYFTSYVRNVLWATILCKWHGRIIHNVYCMVKVCYKIQTVSFQLTFAIFLFLKNFVRKSNFSFHIVSLFLSITLFLSV